MDEFLLLSLKKEIFGVLPRLAGAKDVGCNGRQAGKASQYGGPQFSKSLSISFFLLWCNNEFGLPNSLNKRGVQDGLKKRTILRFFFCYSCFCFDFCRLTAGRGINFVLVVAVSSFLCQGGVLVIVISIGILSLVWLRASKKWVSQGLLL